jgi:hypothetical protein
MGLKKYAFKPHLWGAVHVARPFIGWWTSKINHFDFSDLFLGREYLQ